MAGNNTGNNTVAKHLEYARDATLTTALGFNTLTMVTLVKIDSAGPHIVCHILFMVFELLWNSCAVMNVFIYRFSGIAVDPLYFITASCFLARDCWLAVCLCQHSLVSMRFTSRERLLSRHVQIVGFIITLAVMALMAVVFMIMHKIVPIEITPKYIIPGLICSQTALPIGIGYCYMACSIVCCSYTRTTSRPTDVCDQHSQDSNVADEIQFLEDHKTSLRVLIILFAVSMSLQLPGFVAMVLRCFRSQIGVKEASFEIMWPINDFLLGILSAVIFFVFLAVSTVFRKMVTRIYRIVVPCKKIYNEEPDYVSEEML